MTDGQKTAAIFGTSKAAPEDEVFQIAYQLGRLLAENGFTIANGGYGGTMLAAAEGASQAEGRIIGVTCSAFRRSKANSFITEEIVTDSLQQRLAKLVELGDAYIILPGGTGTLLELAQVWELKNKGFDWADKPIIIIGEFWKNLTELIKTADSESVACLNFVEGAAEAVETLNKFFST